jgi:ribokinase
MARVVVVGSLNVDHTLRVSRFPAAGETVAALGYAADLGGKGFNQAVTAARMGVDVVMVGCVGSDRDGERLLRALGAEGIDSGCVRRHSELPTGRAHITVDESGANTIVVASGANAAVSFPSAALEGADVLLAQLECPMDVVVAAMTAARAVGVTTVLNPAPATPLPQALLRSVDHLVANEHEADHLGRFEYHGIAVVTRGKKGALVLVPGEEQRVVPALPVPVIDTTAAGDAFCGCLAAAVAERRPLTDVLRRATAAGAFTVTAEGAYRSLPYADDVEDLIAQADSISQS